MQLTNSPPPPLGSKNLSLSIAILTQQVSNYHAARYRAAALKFRRFTIISAMNDADFREFLATVGNDLVTRTLCADRTEYRQAVTRGSIWSMTTAALDTAMPDVVAVAGWAFPESLAAISWAQSHEIPVVMMSASQQRDGRRSSFREGIKSRIVQTCRTSLVGGREQGEYLRLLGMPAERIFYGYNAVDNEHFRRGADHARAVSGQLRRSFGLPEKYFLASARFIQKKNLPRLVTSFAQALTQTGTAHHLVLLGDGPDRAQIESVIRNSGLGSRVHLPGFQSYDCLPIYYGLADAFVHVSLAEQWGLVINEAAAAGLPVIVSSPCGAAAELVEDGANGFLVDPTDTASMSAALTQMMRLPPEQRAAMGTRSRQVVADWGPERFAIGLVRAVEAALTAPAFEPAFWDQIIFRLLARRMMSRVA